MTRYLKRVIATNSILCVGIDPTEEHIPVGFKFPMRPMLFELERYLYAVIEIAAKQAPIIKPQYAYFAALGPKGLELLRRITEYAQKLGLLVILDFKRADIGDTMLMYGIEAFEVIGNVDAVTFVPYLGPTFMPHWTRWLADGRSVISMIRTSNPEAAAIQDLELASGIKFYEHMALLTAEWNAKVSKDTDGAGGVGGVIGATNPEQGAKCRELVGDNVLTLAPGYGAQGGGADGAVVAVIDSHGAIKGVVNDSRGITLMSWFDKKAGKPKDGDPIVLVAKAIDAANADLNGAISSKTGMTTIEAAMLAYPATA